MEIKMVLAPKKVDSGLMCEMYGLEENQKQIATSKYSAKGINVNRNS